MSEQETLEAQATEETSENGTGKEVVRRVDRTPLSQRDPVALAQHFAQSGYFKDAADMSKAVVKIVAGEELGFGPMTAMAGIHIIEGKPSLSANLLATCVKRSGVYNYRVVQMSDTEADLTFFEQGQEIGHSRFTIEQAKRAGLVRNGSGWTKYPEAMLFARALTQGVRWHCPDVTAGHPAYTPEELGAQVDERGEVVSLPNPTRAPAPVNKLNPDRADFLESGTKALGLTYREFDLILGSIGVDALRAHSQKARRERIDSLTDEQADALAAELEKLADAEQGDE